jgi:hypothetical protein
MSAVIRATLPLRDGDRAGVARSFVYLATFFPGVCAALQLEQTMKEKRRLKNGKKTRGCGSE